MDTIKKNNIFTYRHLNYYDARFDFLREKFTMQNECLSWFTALVMTADALFPEKNHEEIIEKISSITINLKQNEIEKIVQEICDSPGKLDINALNFISRAGPSLVSSGIGVDYVNRYPKEFIKFLNNLFKAKNIQLYCELFVNPKKIKSNQFLEMLKIKIQLSYVPIISVDLIIGGQSPSGHVIMISGVCDKGIFISDPSREMLTLLDHDMTMKFIKKNILIYYDNNKIILNEKSVMLFIKRRRRIKMKILN